MPRFVYKAKKTPTEIIQGKIEAPDQKNAVLKLRQIGIFPLSIENDRPLLLKKTKRFFLFQKKVPLRDLSAFTRQLSNLLDSGISLVNALSILIEQTQNSLLVDTIIELRSDIKDGTALSGALSKHPIVFSSLYVNMVKSAEVGGMMEAVLSRLADFAESDEETLSKVRTSLAYPALLLGVGAITIFILLSFVAPRLVSMFADLGQALPLPTVILTALSGFFSTFWWLIILVVSVLFIGLNKWARTKEGKRAFDRFKMQSPLLGKFIKISEFARLSRTLATLLKNGVPMIHALDILSKTMANEIIKEGVTNIRRSVIDGLSLSASMKQILYFPAMLVNMVGVGEESGSLEDSLYKIANSYDKELDRMIKVFTTLLEPSMIVILGGIVGFIVIAMLLPIFQINLMVR